MNEKNFILKNVQTGQFFMGYGETGFVYSFTDKKLYMQINDAQKLTFEDAKQIQLLSIDGFHIRFDIQNYNDL